MKLALIFCATILMTTGTAQANEDDIHFYKSEAEPPKETPASGKALILREGWEIRDVDVAAWGGRTYILASAENQVRLYVRDESGQRILGRAGQHGRVVHVGFLPDLSGGSDLWFYTTSQKESIPYYSPKGWDVGFVTSFYLWDGHRLKLKKRLYSAGFRRLGPVLLRQVPDAARRGWGPVEIRVVDRDTKGNLDFKSLGGFPLPPDVSLYDFNRADLDMDGAPEIVCGRGGGRGLSIYANRGQELKGHYDVTMVRSPAAIVIPHWMSMSARIIPPGVLDVDGDRKPELVVAFEDKMTSGEWSLFKSGQAGIRLAIFEWSGTLSKKMVSNFIPGSLLTLREDAANRFFAAVRKGNGDIHFIWLEDLFQKPADPAAEVPARPGWP